MEFDRQERCMGCMKPLAWDGSCSCGFDRESYLSDSHYLPLGSFLKDGDYMVGKVLGEGGFGITYIGFDRNLYSRIAIKEYYPAGFAGRDVSNGNHTVCPYGGDAGKVYESGLEAFLTEARILAKFSGMEGIVNVRCLFQENQTAYIVMEYVEGTSVKEYVLAKDRIPPEMVWKMMRQPIRALQAVHEEHLVHRDVSADNLMIDKNGRITLIDFGSARFSNAIDEKTRTTICKQGFSALEQYSREGKQGPWTDVYSICATIYFMLTKTVPQNSTERIVDDMVEPLSRIDDIDLAMEKKDALMKGMAVKSKERFQNMEALYSALYGEPLKKIPEPGLVFAKGEKEAFAGNKASDRKVPKKKTEDKKPENPLTALLGEALKKREQQRRRDRKKQFYGKAVGGAFAVIVLILIFGGVRGYIYIDAGVGKDSGQMGKGKAVSYVGEQAGSTPLVVDTGTAKAGGVAPVSSTKMPQSGGALSVGSTSVPQSGSAPSENNTKMPQPSGVPSVGNTKMPRSSSAPSEGSTKMPQSSGVPSVDSTRMPQSGSVPSVGNAKTPQAGVVPPANSTKMPQAARVPSVNSTKMPQESGAPSVSNTKIPQSSSKPQEAVSKTVKMPEVKGMKKEKAVQRLKKEGLRCRVVSRSHNNVAAGTVIRSSIAAGKAVEKGKKITLYVSKGKEVVPTPRTAAPRQTPAPPVATRRPVATKKPAATKKPNRSKDDAMAGDLDSILY